MRGSLCVKNKFYYAVLYAKNGKPKQKWINIGFLESGNKKAATAFMNDILEKYGELESFEGLDFSCFTNNKNILPEIFDDNATDVIEVIPELQRAKLSEIITNKPNTLVSEYVWEFIQEKKDKSRKLSPSTLAGYTGYIFAHIKDFFDSKPCFVETFTAQDLKDYIAYQRGTNNLSESTIKKQFQILKPALHRAIYRDGLRDHLPRYAKL